MGTKLAGPFIQGDQILGEHLSRGTEFDGDHLYKGINFMEVVCPGGQKVGNRKSGDQLGSGPNASQPYSIYCKCSNANIARNHPFYLLRTLVNRECVKHGCSVCTNPLFFGISPFSPADFEALSTIGTCGF